MRQRIVVVFTCCALLMPLYAMAQQTRAGAAQQVMSRDHARHMTRLMVQMHTMLRDMSQLMDRQRVRQQDRRMEMARLMDDISQTLNSMSQHMREGTFNAQNREQFQQRVFDLNQRIDQIVLESE